jgi:hypothetical protein
MGLSIEELDLQSTEYLPAREVMSSMGGGPHVDNETAGVATTDVDIHDVNLGIIQDVYIFKGEDSDLVDIDAVQGILNN